MPARKGQIMPRGVTTGLRARAWWLMREKRRFTVPALLQIIADASQQDAASNIGKYTSALARAGYLVEEGREPSARHGDPGHKRYRLVRNTGPKAPVWRGSVRAVFDPNTGELHPVTSHPATVQEPGHE